MKNILHILAIWTLTKGLLFGQCADKNLTTNPQNPINTEKPSKINAFD